MALEHANTRVQARDHGIGIWVALSILSLACVRIWIAPLFRPEGPYLWGHYGLLRIYLGIPVGLATILLAIIALSPRWRQRALAVRLTTLFLATMLGLVAFDTLYFVTVGRRESTWMRLNVAKSYNLPDEELGYRRKPNVEYKRRGYTGIYRTDENGFRNPPGIRKADVAFIGDSFTEAADFPESDSFAQRVGSASGLRVVNLGIGGYSPPQQLVVLRRHALSYHPRFVVWQIFEGNDLRDAATFAQWKGHALPEGSLTSRYMNGSALVQLLRKTEKERSSPTVAHLRTLGGELQPLNDHHGLGSRYMPNQPAKFPLGMTETKRSIEEGYRLCRSQGVQLLVLFIPIKVRVLAPHITFVNSATRETYLPGGRVDSDKDFGSELARFCTELRAPFIDATPALRRRAAQDPAGIYYEIHLGRPGHKVVADLVLNWIRSST